VVNHVPASFIGAAMGPIVHAALAWSASFRAAWRPFTVQVVLDTGETVAAPGQVLAWQTAPHVPAVYARVQVGGLAYEGWWHASAVTARPPVGPCL
jgi:hypothetical protein